MNAQEFVACWKSEKDEHLRNLLRLDSFLGKQLHELNLTVEQHDKLAGIVNGLLTDVFYTLLLGLDGSCQIGGIQETFKIYDEAGNLISDFGEIQVEAFEQFQSIG